jgi:hypothetical protein
MIRIVVFCAQNKERKSFHAELAEFNGERGEIVAGQGWPASAEASPLDG